MRPLRYSINRHTHGCCHHGAGLPSDEQLMRHWTAQIDRADALLFGRDHLGADGLPRLTGKLTPRQ